MRRGFGILNNNGHMVRLESVSPIVRNGVEEAHQDQVMKC